MGRAISMRPITRVMRLAACLGGMLGIVSMYSGCGHSEDRYLQRRVTSEELIGLWRMSSRSPEDLRDVGYKETIDPHEHRITLRSDGTCHFQTILVSREFEKLDGSCRWRLSGGIGDRQTLDLEIGMDRSPSARTFYYFDEENQDGRLVLWRHITDPDMWRYVEYTKVLDPQREG